MALVTSPATAAVQPLVSPAWQGFAPEDLSGFVAAQCFPVVPVSAHTGAFNKFTRETVQQSVNAVRTSGGVANNMLVNATKSTFNVKDFALSMNLTAQDISTFGGQDYIDAQRQNLISAVLRAMDEYWATKYFVTSFWDSNPTTPTTKWGSASSDPVADVGAQIDAVDSTVESHVKKIGICNTEVFNALSRHPDIQGVEAVLGLSPRMPSNTMKVAERLGLDDILVARANKITSVKGASTVTDSRVFGNHFLVLGVSESNAQSGNPTAGRTHLLTPISVREADPGPLENQGNVKLVAEAEVSFDSVFTEMGSWLSTVIS